MKKTCSKCGINKLISDFSKDKRRKDGLQVCCKTCQKGFSRKFWESHPGYMTERINEVKREYWIHQGGRCAICQDVIPMIYVKTRKYHLDHDHSCHPTSQSCVKCRRGLLCPGCNQGIGHLREDIQILQNAISYLESSSSLC